MLPAMEKSQIEMMTILEILIELFVYLGLRCEMSQEEKYKLALFAVVRNSKVMPAGVKLGKSMHEINTMTVAVMANIMESCDFERLKESYESV